MNNRKKERISVVYVRNVRGSITVFMTFIFLIILSLILAFFENTRIISSTGYVKNASFAAQKALFGDYNKELYEEYGLFGYGGCDGIKASDMCQEFNEIVHKNLCTKPENASLAYTDIYKIRAVRTEMKKYQGFADSTNLVDQLKKSLGGEVLGDFTDKVQGRHSNDIKYDKKELCRKFDDADSYEKGKYKEIYGETDEECKQSEAGGSEQAGNDKNGGRDKVVKGDDNEAGNPLEVFKELVKNGYISLVCDEKSLSDKKIEKAFCSQNFDAAENESEENGKKDTYVEKDTNLKNENPEEYESAGDFLKGLFLNTDTEGAGLDNMTSCGTDKLIEILYADKKFSSYTKDMERTADYGLEYLICGKEKERDNLAGVINRLIAARMLINFALISGNEELKTKALATAAAIAGITGLEPVVKGVQYVILAILAFEESCIDTAALLDGRKIPLIKKVGDIKIKYEEICMVSGSFFKDKAKQYEKGSGDITKKFMDYREYILGFLFVTSEEKIKERLLDVIQYDLRERYNESFNIYDCIVAADCQINYKMKFIFPFLWDMYGKRLKYQKFKRQVRVAYKYE